MILLAASALAAAGQAPARAAPPIPEPPTVPAPYIPDRLGTPHAPPSPPVTILARQTAGTIDRSDIPRGLPNLDRLPPFVRIIISPEGRAAQCYPIFSAGYASADEALCRAVTERFRFDPARDAVGNPTSEIRILQLRWDGAGPAALPAPAPSRPAGRDARRAAGGARPAELISGAIRGDDYPANSIRQGEQGRVTTRLVVGRSGRLESCSVVRSSGFTRLDNAACMLFILRLRFDPARDEQGNPVEEALERSITWSLDEPAAPPSPPAPGQ